MRLFSYFVYLLSFQTSKHKIFLPLITAIFCWIGNDLSRILRWGAGYAGNEDPLSLLLATDHAEVTRLDR